MQHRFAVGRGTVVLERADITRLDTDAIANAANGSLLGGGGVDGAIHAAAGPGLLDACREVKKALPSGMLHTGGAVITPGFQLKARFVIHCVGPVYARAGDQAPRLLASCYETALELCRQHQLRSIAFPSISTGVYGYPIHEAAPIALAAVKRFIEAQRLPMLVRFALFDDRTLSAYVCAAEKLLAPGS